MVVDVQKVVPSFKSSQEGGAIFTKLFGPSAQFWFGMDLPFLWVQHTDRLSHGIDCITDSCECTALYISYIWYVFVTAESLSLDGTGCCET